MPLNLLHQVKSGDARNWRRVHLKVRSVWPGRKGWGDIAISTSLGVTKGNPPRWTSKHTVGRARPWCCVLAQEIGRCCFAPGLQEVPCFPLTPYLLLKPELKGKNRVSGQLIFCSPGTQKHHLTPSLRSPGTHHGGNQELQCNWRHREESGVILHTLWCVKQTALPGDRAKLCTAQGVQFRVCDDLEGWMRWGVEGSPRGRGYIYISESLPCSAETNHYKAILLQ